MNSIIGRNYEKTQLRKIFDSSCAEFVAVYGRRRVGKTFLIRNFFKNQPCLFFDVTGVQNESSKEQIQTFTRSLEKSFFQNKIPLKDPKNWKEAFDLLTYAMKKTDQKIILFFDELPWLATQKSSFLPSLNYYWNHYWSSMPNVKLIVCGSAASWIIDHIINSKGGLHNRVTLKLSLEPFTLSETKDYLRHLKFKYSDSQILELYMTMGGIPYYLNFLDPKNSVPQNIDALFFNKKGALLHEFNVLYSSLFEHAEAYEELIRIIASKRNGVTRQFILSQAKFSSEGGTFNKRLQALEECGFITSFKLYDASKKGRRFRLIDEYSLFYLSWIEPVLSTLKKIGYSHGYWLEIHQSPSWRAWSGYAFESVIFKHIVQVEQTLKIPPSSLISAWEFLPSAKSKEEGAQIDLLFDRTDTTITLCEIKYTSKPYALTKPEAQALLKKSSIFEKHTKTRKTLAWALITVDTPAKTLYYDDIIMGNVSLKDLMK